MYTDLERLQDELPLLVVGGDASTFVSVASAVDLLMADLHKGVTERTVEGERYSYPVGGCLRAFVINIPTTRLEEIKTAIQRAFETADAHGYIVMPVASVTIVTCADKCTTFEYSMITLRVDASRINETAPLSLLGAV